MAKSKKVTAVEPKDQYDGNSIKELPFPLCVQQRSAMYIGNPDFSGLLVCIREILNNSVDEFLTGNCTVIKFVREDEFSFSITDNGRGVPFDVVDGKNSLSRIFGTLHAGRNFVEKTVYSTGLNGVGASLANALSSSFKVTSTRKDKRGYIRFEEGYEKELKLSKLKSLPKAPFDKSSTKVSFTFNLEYFEKNIEIDNEAISKLVRDTAYLNNNLKVIFEDKVNGTSEIFKFNDGVKQLLNNEICTDAILKNPINLGIDTIKDTKIEIAFTYNNSFKNDNIISFCNTIHTSEGGTHVTGFKRSISQKFLAHLTSNRLCKEKITNDDIFYGLNAIVSVFVFNPKYTSQTKQCLKNTEVMGHVVTFTNKALDEWLACNPSEMKIIAARIDLAAKSRIAQKRALDSIKKEQTGSFLTSLAAPEKFTDCNSDDRMECELFLVEG